MEHEHLIDALTLAAINDSWCYGIHEYTRKSFSLYLTDALLTGKRELRKELEADNSHLPTLTPYILKAVLRELLDHYSEEIIDTALNQLTRE